MGDPVTMALTGAAIGGGTSLLRGKGLGSALQNAALSGALGGVTGAAGQAMGVGSGAASSSLAGTTAATEAGAPPFEGAVFNKATGSWMNPEYFTGSSVGFPTYNGGEGTLSNAMGDLKSKVPDWMTADNLKGAASVYSLYPHQQRAPVPQAQSSVKAPSQISQSPPTPLDGLLASIQQTQSQYKQPHFSLLG